MANCSILFDFPGHETTVAAVARSMKRHGLTPDDALAAYDAWLRERMAEMEPPPGLFRGHGTKSDARRKMQGLVKPPSSREVALRAGGSRHKAGDFAQLPASCPACGGTVELYQMCPIESPVWRTQLACMADGCAWHGKSKLPIDALLAAGAARLQNHVTEG